MPPNRPRRSRQPQIPHKDVRRHAAIRAGFLRALVADPRVVATFEEWSRRTGLSTEARKLRRTLERLIAEAAEPPVTLDQLFNAVALIVRPSVAPQTPKDRLMASAWASIEAYGERESAATAQAQLAGAARRFAQNTLGLTWPWLAPELLAHFTRHVRRTIVGVSEGMMYVFDGEELPAAPRLRAFQYMPRESVADAQCRLEKWHTEAGAILASRPQRVALPRGRPPILGKYGEWLYRYRVRRPRESLKRIARDHSPKSDTRAFIRCRIEEAERVLAPPAPVVFIG